MLLVIVSKWFATRELDRRVWLVAEPGHVIPTSSRGARELR